MLHHDTAPSYAKFLLPREETALGIRVDKNHDLKKIKKLDFFHLNQIF